MDGEIILAKCDDYLQCSIYSLNNVSVKFSVEISTAKETKIMACRGIESIRSKICIRMMQEVFECKNSFCQNTGNYQISKTSVVSTLNNNSNL